LNKENAKSVGKCPLEELYQGTRITMKASKPVFLNVYGAQESIPRNKFRQLCSLAGRYDNPIPTRFLALIDFLKIPALFAFVGIDSNPLSSIRK
jgi:hypothetical protein